MTGSVLGGRGGGGPPPPPPPAGGRDPPRQPADRQRVAPLDVRVGTVEQLEVDRRLPDAQLCELVAKGDRPKVEVELVAAPGIDPDGSQGAERLGPSRGHPNRGG